MKPSPSRLVSASAVTCLHVLDVSLKLEARRGKKKEEEGGKKRKEARWKKTIPENVRDVNPVVFTWRPRR